MRRLTSNEDREARRLAILAEASRTFGAARLDDLPTLLEAIARTAASALGSRATIVTVSEDGSGLDVMAAHDTNPARDAVVRELHAAHPPKLGHGISGRVIATGEPILIPHVDHAALATELPPEQRPPVVYFDAQSILAVPMRAHREVVGALAISRQTPDDPFDEVDLSLAQDLADRAGIAVANARLYAAERRQRARLDALVALSHAFAKAQLDLEVVLDTLVRRVAETFGDYCQVGLVDGRSSTIRLAAAYHPDAAVVALAREVNEAAPHELGRGLTGRVAATGEPLLMPVTDPSAVADLVRAEHRAWLERYPVHSVAIVPLRVEGRVLGTLGITRTEPGRPFTHDDVAFLQDLGDRAALAIENARLHGELRAALRSRDDFLGIAAHELRSPITSLRGYAQLLQRSIRPGQPIDEDRLRAGLAHLDGQSRRLSDLADRLLDIARIQSGRLQMEPRPIDLTAVVAETVDALRTRYADRVLELQADGPIRLVADPVRVGQVLTNLIDNAVKFSPTDRPVEIAVEQGIDGALVAVRDHGPGVPEPERARIFERLYQVDPTRHHGGLGLGLHVTRQLVELHGGNIAVESAEGGGARFVVRFPARSPGARGG